MAETESACQEDAKRNLFASRTPSRWTRSAPALCEATLTIDKARELAWALLTLADAVEFVSAPVTEILSALNYPGGHTTN
jgi:hypothetical protein